MDTLKNQLAVVTGASSGIGKTISLALAGHGAEVCLVARRREALETVAERIRGNGGRSHVCSADLASDEDIQSLAQKINRDFGRVDVLVLCGLSRYCPSCASGKAKSSSSIPLRGYALPQPWASSPRHSTHFEPSPIVCATKSMATASAS